MKHGNIGARCYIGDLISNEISDTCSTEGVDDAHAVGAVTGDP
jgi:hypothetical protein